MVLGAFAAIGQSNIKRLLAYSSIGHMGFALVGLAAGGADGVRGVVVYMIIYMIMTLGTFACVVAMRRRDGPVETISDLAGLARHDKFMAFVLAMLMFSLAGIPPLAGFFAKYFVFMAAIKSGLVTLAVIGVIASVVSAYYYLRIVKLIYFDEPVAGIRAGAGRGSFGDPSRRTVCGRICAVRPANRCVGAVGRDVLCCSFRDCTSSTWPSARGQGT